MFENSIQRGSQSPPLQASASSRLPRHEPRKLRASCDGCYLSKVKCTKERPTCTRCLNHGVPCKYSPCGRIGKPRRLHDHQQVHDPEAAKILSSSSISDASVHPPPYSWKINFDPSATARTAEFNLDDEISSMIWQSPLSATESENGGFLDDANRDSNLSSPSNSLPTPVESLCDYVDVSQPMSAGLERLGKSVQHQPSQPLLSEELSLLPDPLPPLYFPATQDPIAAAKSFPSTETCTCATTTFDILRTLHDQASHTSFDKVLSCNKSAVSTIAKVLSCTCTRDSTSVMTLAVALTKIMSRYQSIGGRSSQSSGTDATTDAFTFAPSPTPITLGAYKLDGAEEQEVKLHVILSELRKVDGLMARYQDRFCTGPVKHEARVYNELVMFLRRRLRDIGESLQKNLQTVYESSSI